MIPMGLRDVATLTGGELHPGPGAGRGARVEDVLVDGPVVTDSREAGPGSLYVARVGEHADGHRFLGLARDKGAVAALTTRPVGELPCVVVDDVQAAFGRLARGVVDRCPKLRVIGITGSSGKTGTKDLLASVLATVAETVAPVGSLNGEVGVPLTVCRVTPSTRFLVVEMGARAVGHIRYLTEVAPPGIALVLNVGSAHLGEFGSIDRVAHAKAELVQALPPDGVAILNADEPVVAAMGRLTDARVVTVGRSEGAMVRATDVALDGLGRPSFTLAVGGRSAPVTLALHGEHQVGNALSVAAAALECRLGLEQVAAALGAARATSRWRMEVIERDDGVTVVNDAYNANPDSVRAALAALAGMAGGRPPAEAQVAEAQVADGQVAAGRVAGERVGRGERPQAPDARRRTWAVLGEMLELGDQSRTEHERVGRLAATLGIDQVLAVGEGARPVVDGARLAGPAPAAGAAVSWVPDADTAYRLLCTQLRRGDVVLLKSSRDAGLRWLGDRLVGLEVPG